MALPAGDQGSFGVAACTACAQRLVSALGPISPGEVNKPARLLKGYAEEICAYCNPEKNPTAFRNCQAAALPAAKPLLALVRDTHQGPTRILALEALVWICFGNTEAAAFVAECANLDEAVREAFRPIKEAGQQHEHLAALQFLQALAAACPEAPAFSALLPYIVSEVEGESGGFVLCRAVRLVAIEVLVSLSQSRSRRLQVAASLPEPLVDRLLEAAGSEPHLHSFITGLLLANLCDLNMPSAPHPSANAEEGVEQVQDQLRGDSNGKTFGDAARDFWQGSVFFSDLAACLQAALCAEPWPPQSNGFHAPWKLAGTCMRLALAGYTAELHECIAPLMSTIEARGAESLPATDAARAARLAAVALRALLLDDRSGRVQQHDGIIGIALKAALEAMASEEPAAGDLLEGLTPQGEEHESSGSFCGIREAAAVTAEA